MTKTHEKKLLIDALKEGCWYHGMNCPFCEGQKIKGTRIPRNSYRPTFDTSEERKRLIAFHTTKEWEGRNLRPVFSQPCGDAATLWDALDIIDELKQQLVESKK